VGTLSFYCAVAFHFFYRDAYVEYSAGIQTLPAYSMVGMVS